MHLDHGHCLTQAERQALGNMGDVLDLTRIRFHRGRGGRWANRIRRLVLRISANRAVALGDHVFLPDHCCESLPVLAHEVLHCVQYQQWGAWRYYARGIKERLQERKFHRHGIGRSPYHYRLEKHKRFEDYGMEEQGQIVEDCFRGDQIAWFVSPFKPPK